MNLGSEEDAEEEDADKSDGGEGEEEEAAEEEELGWNDVFKGDRDAADVEGEEEEAPTLFSKLSDDEDEASADEESSRPQKEARMKTNKVRGARCQINQARFTDFYGRFRKRRQTSIRRRTSRTRTAKKRP